MAIFCFQNKNHAKWLTEDGRPFTETPSKNHAQKTPFWSKFQDGESCLSHS